MTVMVVTHGMGFAREVAHRILFMGFGRVLQDDRPGAFSLRRRPTMRASSSPTSSARMPREPAPLRGLHRGRAHDAARSRLCAPARGADDGAVRPRRASDHPRSGGRVRRPADADPRGGRTAGGRGRDRGRAEQVDARAPAVGGGVARVARPPRRPRGPRGGTRGRADHARGAGRGGGVRCRDRRAASGRRLEGDDALDRPAASRDLPRLAHAGAAADDRGAVADVGRDVPRAFSRVARRYERNQGPSFTLRRASQPSRRCRRTVGSTGHERGRSRILGAAARPEASSAKAAAPSASGRSSTQARSPSVPSASAARAATRSARV